MTNFLLALLLPRLAASSPMGENLSDHRLEFLAVIPKVASASSPRRTAPH